MVFGEYISVHLHVNAKKPSKERNYFLRVMGRLMLRGSTQKISLVLLSSVCKSKNYAPGNSVVTLNYTLLELLQCQKNPTKITPSLFIVQNLKRSQLTPRVDNIHIFKFKVGNGMLNENPLTNML